MTEKANKNITNCEPNSWTKSVGDKVIDMGTKPPSPVFNKDVKPAPSIDNGNDPAPSIDNGNDPGPDNE